MLCLVLKTLTQHSLAAHFVHTLLFHVQRIYPPKCLPLNFSDQHGDQKHATTP